MRLINLCLDCIFRFYSRWNLLRLILRGAAFTFLISFLFNKGIIELIKLLLCNFWHLILLNLWSYERTIPVF